MKPTAFIPGLLAALCLAAPATGLGKDKHHHHKNNCDSHSRSYSRHYSSGSHYRHCSPYSYGYRSSSFFHPTYSNYSYGYPGYSTYYARPALSLSFSSSPSYYRSRTADYADDLAVDVQRALRRRGYYRGEIDGDVGPGTRGAIRQYQYAHRLEVTGRIDRSLLRSLGLS